LILPEIRALPRGVAHISHLNSPSTGDEPDLVAASMEFNPLVCIGPRSRRQHVEIAG